jgi:hypothetical protein
MELDSAGIESPGIESPGIESGVSELPGLESPGIESGDGDGLDGRNPQPEPKRCRVGAMLPLAAVVAGIAASEWVFAYRDVAYGIAIALFLALVIYLGNALLIEDAALTRCLNSLALIPLYILFTSSLPWFFIDQQYLIPAVYAVVLILCFFHIYHNQLNLAGIFNLRPERLVRHVLLGILCGLPLGVVEYLILHPAPALPSFDLYYLLQQSLYMILFVGFGEELLFRGLIQNDLVRLLGSLRGVLMASLIFCILHLTWRSAPELGFAFLAGLAFGYGYHRTRSLTLPIMMHAAGNVLLVAVLPYLLR